MAGNTFGKLFTVTTFGESHGPALGCIVDGCPPGMELSEADIQPELDRRRPGSSRFVTQRREPDTVRILSGVYQGKTTGTPVALMIENQDQRSKDYSNIADVFRPGHGDYTYFMKYGIRDPRGGGRSSARLTAATVGAAAIARKWLRLHFGTEIRGCLSQLGDTAIPFRSWDFTSGNPFFAATDDAVLIAMLENRMDALRKAGDSIGAKVDVVVSGVPVGLGNPLFGKLDAEIAAAMMGINAVKGVEIGDGFASVVQKGSEHGDEITPEGFSSNHAGGVLGGISTGMPVVFRAAFKPTPSISRQQDSVSLSRMENTTLVIHGRHDPCIVPRAVPCVEAAAAIAVLDAWMGRKKELGYAF